MSEEHPPRPPKRTPATRDRGAGNVAYLDQALWRGLAEAETAAAFCHSWLGLQSRMIGGVSLGVVVLEREGGGSFAPAALWPRGTRDAEPLTGVVQRAIEERKGVVQRSDTDHEGASPDDLRFLLAYPVTAGGGLRGVAAVQIAPRPQVELEQAMRQLQWGVAWLENWVNRRSAEPAERSRERLTAVLELTALVLEQESFKAAATAFVTEMATRLDCDRVSVGFLRGKQVKVHALSHSAQFGKQMNLIRSIGMAMSEAVDQRVTLAYPEPEGKSHDVLHAHEQLARAHGDQAVCTVPFVDREGVAFGAMTLERSAPAPFEPHTLELCDGVAAVAGPILEQMRRNDRPLVATVRDSVRSQVHKLVGPRHAVRKLVAGGVLALVLFFAFATGEYRVTAKATLEGQIQRVVAAPYRGFIFDAAVRAGDVVREGQTMCTLDDRDLHLEYSRWSSEREQYVLEHRRAMADGELAATNVLTKKMRQAEAQLALLKEQIDRARIVAPFDGIVVSGDLSQSLGAPVETGQVLFEVAPLDAYRVMLQVDEHDVGDVEVGQKGEMVLTALPGTRLDFTVTKITPVSVSEEGTNSFMVEAELDRMAERLRPGMEGVGKVRVDRRRLIWIWTHDLVDWLRLKAWTWLY